jgi:hypothetical protein
MIEIAYPKKDEVNNSLAAYYINEAASRLRMSEKSVRRQIARGNLRRCNKFGRILIPSKDVDNFFDRFSGFAV